MIPRGGFCLSVSYWLSKAKETHMYSLTGHHLIHGRPDQCANEELIHIPEWNREQDPLPRGGSWTSWASESSSLAVESRLRSYLDCYLQLRGPRGSTHCEATLFFRAQNPVSSFAPSTSYRSFIHCLKNDPPYLNMQTKYHLRFSFEQKFQNLKLNAAEVAEEFVRPKW